MPEANWNGCRGWTLAERWKRGRLRRLRVPGWSRLSRPGRPLRGMGQTGEGMRLSADDALRLRRSRSPARVSPCGDRGKRAARDTKRDGSPGQTACRCAAAVTSNVQQARTSGLGCVDEATLQQASSCEAAKPADECERERAKLIDTRACFAITAGTTAAIEAGSHSFDWLRVRVPGTIQSLWTARSLFLQN
jgi:hypothetical protein